MDDLEVVARINEFDDMIFHATQLPIARILVAPDVMKEHGSLFNGGGLAYPGQFFWRGRPVDVDETMDPGGIRLVVEVNIKFDGNPQR